MNTEHQNPKIQLPRAIEEKPIVYDDIALEEVREVAALPPIHLSPDGDRICHLTFRQRVQARRCRRRNHRAIPRTGNPRPRR